MKKFLLFMLGVLLALPGIARDFTYEYEGQTLTYTVISESAKTCMTKSGTEGPNGRYVEWGNYITGELIIPSVAKNGGVEYTVTEIGFGSFYHNPLTSLTIPESVTTIGSRSFEGCPLTSMFMGNSVTKIGDKAFYGCEDLRSLTLPETVTTIGRYAFYECTGLTSLTLPEAVTSIGGFAFSECTGLTSVTIGNSVTTIGYGSFRHCTGLTSVTIPDAVTEIEGYAFNSCTNLRSVAIGNSVTKIGDMAFGYCGSLSSVIIPESVTIIDSSAFHTCTGLTSVTIGNSVTTIGNMAFHDCRGLTSVLIPNSVTRIDGAAFNFCTGLKKSAYPSGLSNPFGDGIAIEYPREGSIIEDGFVYGPEKTAIYFAPLSLEGDYIIPPSVTTIGNNAFAECSGLKKGAYPSGLSNPFRNGYSIEYPREGAIIEDGFVFGPEKKTIYFAPFSLEGEYVIPEFVTKIGKDAFEYCIGLTSVIIPNSVIEIGKYAFYFCSGIRKLAYPSGNFETTGIFDCETEIEYPREGAIIEDGFVFGPEKNAIYFAPLSLEGEYVIPKSVTKIGEHAFEYCTGLTSVKATPINPPVMDDNSFDGLYDTAALSVPVEGATDYLATNWTLFKDFRIGDSEAAGQTYETGNLKYMLIPGKTKEDKNLAVVIPGDYWSLTEVTIPERFTVSDNGTNVRYYVDGIGCNAFKGCSNLATVTFNSRNASHIIGDYAFAQTTISELTIPETVEAIGNHAFAKCSSLTGIVIPGKVQTIGNHAFEYCRSLTNIEIPGSVETIGDYAFSDAWKLKTVTLNEGLKSIGEKAFNSSGTTEVLNVPSTLQSIGIDAFKDFKCKNVHISDLCAWCNIDFGNAYSNPATYSKRLYLNGEMIENLVIPESVSAIKDYAFYWNRALKSVKFNEALQSIGVCAFFNCGSCTTLEIPGNVTYIDKTAFADISIKNLTFAYGPKPIVFDGVNGFSTISTRSLSCDRPLESLNLDFNNLESLTIGNSVTEIPAAKFKEASKLASLTLGNSLTTIGDEAFSGCSAITEVILPPSVETIGASAFAGSNNLTSIIMGHNVTTIGEKAYDLCPAQTVSITAQTPPTAPDNTFSNYTGNLYVQGEDAVKAYYNSDFCWFQFEGHVMIEPTDLKVEGDKTLTGKPGDTFQLTARLYPEGVTLPQIFWRSTNPDIATVDANGLVTLHADLSEIMTMAEGDDSSANSCRIIAESLYSDGPVAEVTVNNNQSGVDTIFDNNDPKEIDFTAPVEVYNLQGVKVATTVDHLSAGIYIVRQGKNVMKMAVK